MSIDPLFPGLKTAINQDRDQASLNENHLSRDFWEFWDDSANFRRKQVSDISQKLAEEDSQEDIYKRFLFILKDTFELFDKLIESNVDDWDHDAQTISPQEPREEFKLLAKLISPKDKAESEDKVSSRDSIDFFQEPIEKFMQSTSTLFQESTNKGTRLPQDLAMKLKFAQTYLSAMTFKNLSEKALLQGVDKLVEKADSTQEHQEIVQRAIIFGLFKSMLDQLETFFDDFVRPSIDKNTQDLVDSLQEVTFSLRSFYTEQIQKINAILSKPSDS
jgi:DNA-binding ferritin-like protein (Dps family)